MLRAIVNWLVGPSRPHRSRHGSSVVIDERSRARLGGALSRGLKVVSATIKRDQNS